MKGGKRLKRLLLGNGCLAAVIRLAEVIVAIEWAMTVVIAFRSHYRVIGHNAVLNLITMSLGMVGFLLSAIIGGCSPQYRTRAYKVLFGSWAGVILLMLIGALTPA